MRSIVFFRAAVASATLLAALAARPALADVAIEGGAFATKGTVSGGAALSLGVFKAPVVPLAVQITGAVPTNGNGYAVTADLRFSPGGTTIGAGAGLGNLGATASTSTIYDAILGQSLAPHLSIEARLYLGPNRPSSAFAGLRLSF